MPNQSLQREHDELGQRFGVIVALTIGVVATVATLSGPNEERWGLLDGASAWPSEILRGIAIGLGVVLMGKAFAVYRSIAHRAAIAGDRSRSGESAPELSGSDSRDLSGERKRYSLLSWTAGGPDRDHIDVGELLAELAERCGWRAVVYRVCLRSTGLIAVFTGVLVAYPPDTPPIRGHLPFYLHFLMMGLLAFVLNLLALIAFDAAQVCMRYTRLLMSRPSDWPESALETSEKLSPYNGCFAPELLDIESIAASTDRVMRLVLYPVALSAIAFLAWHPAIDAWDIGPSAVALYGSSVVLAGAAAWQLRRHAGKARARAIARVAEMACEDADAAAAVTTRLREESRGAFAGWQRDPTFQTVLVPLAVIVLAKSLELLGVIG